MTDPAAQHGTTGHAPVRQEDGDSPEQAIAWCNATAGWTSTAERRIDPIPRLHGTLHTDGRLLDHAGRDLGNIVHTRPSAVLVPGDVDDIAAMVAYCNRHDIPVSARGTGHAMHGQAQVHDGLVIDMAALDTVHAVRSAEDGGGVIDVDAGVTWSTVVAAAADHGLAFPCLTGYLDLSVGGTLSVGGISPAYARGAQVDHVLGVQVVTGRGEAKWCDPTSNDELFEAVLAGLGQYGVITRVVLQLMPMPRQVRTLRLPYPDPVDAVAAMTTLVERAEADEVFCMIFPPGPDATPTYLVIVSAFGDLGDLPDPGYLLRGLPASPAPAQPEDTDYLTHATQYTGPINRLRHDAGWDRLVKPWFDVFLTEQTVAAAVSRIVAAMEPEDWTPAGGGFVLLFPLLRDSLTRPQLRMPDADAHRDQGAKIVFLFDVLDAHPDDSTGNHVRGKIDRNRWWWDHVVVPAGGRRYPIGVLDFAPADWSDHYGDRLPRIRRLRSRYDPAGLFATGQHVFARYHD